MKRFTACVLALILFFGIFAVAEDKQNDTSLDIALNAAEKMVNLISMDSYLDLYNVSADVRQFIQSYTGDWARKDKLIDSTRITIPDVLFDTILAALLLKDSSYLELIQYSDYMMQSMATIPVSLLNAQIGVTALAASSIARYSELRCLESMIPGITYMLLDYGSEHPYILVSFIVAEDHAATVNASLLLIDRERVEAYLKVFTTFEGLADILLNGLDSLKASNTDAVSTPSLLAFSDFDSSDLIKSLNGKQVEINGYMSTFLPASGEFMYLMNTPYNSSPYHDYRTAQLTSTIAVYAEESSHFEFTDRIVKVIGELEMGNFEDEFGYDYSYRIVDANVEVLELKDLSGDYAIWTQLSQDGVASEIHSMFDFLHFVCQWSDYYLNLTDENGKAEQVHMWPGDVINLLSEPAPYGYAEQNSPDYFTGLISRVNAIGSDKLNGLVQLLSECEQLKNEALLEIQNEHYSYNEIYDSYKQNSYDMLHDKWSSLYERYIADFLQIWKI